jgi:mono/diheme cytochrome c family protein
MDEERRSLSAPLLVASLALVAALVWAIYDESVVQRPWKGYQREFQTRYTAYLKAERPRALAAEQAVYGSSGFQDIDRQLKEAEAAAVPQVSAIDAALRETRSYLDAIKDPLQDARAQVAALTYDLDRSTGARRAALQQRIDRVEVDTLEERFRTLRDKEARLIAEQTAIARSISELRRRREEYVADRANGMTRQRIDGLLRKTDAFEVGIKQISVPELGLVDRCESCHLGVREPLRITALDMGGDAVFATHPRPELLATHDPDRFGCTLCHNGNGAATSSTAKAHGANPEWPWPLFDKDVREAGCVQCHRSDRVLETAPTLTRGRDLFETKGCVGCHRYEGYDRAADALAATRQEIRKLEQQTAADRLEIEREIARGDSAASNDEAREHYARADRLRIALSSREGRAAELTRRTAFLAREKKDVGPTLLDVRQKLQKAWIPVWLTDPQAFRPGTKMPHFRMTEPERRAVAAFIWQSGVDGPNLAPEPRGNAAHGKELYESRGCLACHSAELRLGEKANYDYIVRWIHDPQKTSMPNFRLSWTDARDIATYLTSQKRSTAAYAANVSYLDDGRLAATGRTLVDRLGCANCHEIRGFENAPRVGTELTREGEKPVEQMDFGLLEPAARRDGWYSAKGFFTHKLTEPAVYDRGRTKADADKLRMPDVELTPEDVRALTTFLVGSVDPPKDNAFRIVPSTFRYEPQGAAKDLQDGWWIVRKYNCTACHTIQAGQPSALSMLPRYQDADWKEKLPPSLTLEGARVSPQWLANFLANPATNEKDGNRNGVRSYLDVRMPTFPFTPDEIQALVKFFQALAGQPQPFVSYRLEPLDTRERELARALFSSKTAVCLKCHLVGEPKHDERATAPNFLIAGARLQPDWTTRWMLDPQSISPGTAMPSKLFRHDGTRWVFAGPLPDGFAAYTKDHVQLLIRYMFEMTPEEQRRLIALLPRTPPRP